MEMVSRSSSHVDEDDFDWEAAVREIDSACQATIPSTSYSGTSVAIANGACSKPTLPLFRARQSTLDSFVNKKEKQKAEVKICTESDFEDPAAGENWVRNNPSEPDDGDPAVSIDLEAAKNWIYPVNVPLRDYQFAIAKTALFSNTLVALPTGLGKTLIAAVVMYNYFRWFPQGKIVFAAPSRPLVMQQIEACHNIVGIPQEWTIDMTGQMSPPKRSRFWKAKRVFFLTPQVFEKDIHSGICLVRQLVCLVFDEAHRAMGNYSYCVVVRELMAIPMKLRILALTATPGSKHHTIQNVIDNLHISTLEYRNESDHDVNSYMHNRKLELVEVPMGEDVVGINCMLLQAIQPFVTRLNDIGALPHRDFSTLSPSELLSLRDKFRQAPPPSHPYPKGREIEAYFSILITFYHIRKLLSSHGIRPAYEMIQDKLNQGFFLKIVSKIEAFWKAKNLMDQSLSNGVPSPKVVKMLEILINHFKTKDPYKSRVIIFSNFRGSVRDIMGYLSSIGDIVRATEFVGQSSGKTLKGQSQKVQQAVLEKFRSGGYNVIVATSIGEEGLDIMEVDLVICFDANVSPLRMIQRMGRTGRKNDGRVVVLACEGSELKSYLKKQATSKAMKKHMHNGGVKSFNFHCSPRMVPHIFKPQVQYLEMSIDQFVHRGKKVTNSNMDRSPFLSTISTEERNIIAKYFPQTADVTWQPSLIAFPSFQVLPSQVSRVRHSFKTASMFIDAMQDLQGLSLFKANNDAFIEVDPSSQPHNELNASGDNIGQGSVLHCTISDVGGSPFQASTCQMLEDVVLEDHHDVPKPKPHCFLFSKDYVTVSSLGSVLIAYVPAIQRRGSKKFQGFSTVTRSLFPGGPKSNHSSLCSLMTSETPTIHVENPKIKASSDLKETCNGPPSNLIAQAIQNDQQSKKHVYKSPGCEQNHQDIEKSTNEAADIELSPRLTHFIEDGVVPESPVINVNLLCPRNVENILFPTRPLEETSMHERKMTGVENTMIDANEKNVISPANEAVHTPNTMNQRSSDDWKCSSGEASNSFFKDHKYKRLCKHGDVGRKLPIKTLEKKFELVEAACGSSIRAHENKLNFRNGENENSIKHVDAFIDEEAELSCDASVSEDEAVDEKNDQYDDSFIDDRINPTEGSTEAENSGIDMTAFYRRSLLTQSPILLPGKYLTTSGETLSSGTVGSCSPEKRRNLTATPQRFIQSVNQLDHQNSTIGNAASGTAASDEASRPERCSDKLESRKRKLIFRPSATILEEIPPANAGSAPDHPVKVGPSDTHFSCDDDFYLGIDFDEVEAQATKLLRCRSDLSFRESEDVVHDRASTQIDEGTGIGFICSPLFDLGI